jgi:tRNA(Ile2) C34 agmatinyltransferase TiaS
MGIVILILMKHRLGLTMQFSKSTILVNKILGKFKLRLCKDCQKITTSNNLRCSKCDTIHTEFRYEELRAELQYE